MCGILGIALKAVSGSTMSDAKMFEELLYIDALRGDDSTGVAALYNDGEMQIIKEATTADYFRYTKDFDQVMKRFISKGKAIIGHNRKKTIGKVEDATAHPFLIDDRYAFIHNGTLQNHEKLHKTDVDSEALGMVLTACEGDPKKIEEALSRVEGAYACAWFDQVKEKLYLVRNKDRPLCIAETTIGYMFCSEYAFMLAAAGRNRLKLENVEIVDEDTLYTIELKKDYGVSLTKDKLTVKKATPPVTHGGVTNITAGGAGRTTAGKQSTFPSKNFFKKFRKDAIGEIISFWMDDYIDLNTDPNCSSWLLWGECFALEFNHVVKGHLKDVPLFEMKSRFDECLLSGRISDVTYNEQDKQMEVHVIDIKSPIVTPKKVH